MRHAIALFISAILLTVATAQAQIVTTTPSPLTTASAPITITFHADQGSRGLAGLTPSTAVFAHTGVILRGESGWQKAPAWLDNSNKYRLRYAGTDTWLLDIPSIQSYYGLTSEELQRVEKLMFVFRNADGSREGKTASGGDISVNVFPEGFHVALALKPDSRIISSSSPVTVTATATLPATITITADGKSYTSTAETSSFSTEISLAGPGGYTVTATAKTSSGLTASASTTLLRPAPTATAPYPGGKPVSQAPVFSADMTEATFAIAAPGKKSVILAGSWNDFALIPEQEMTRATETVALPADTSFIKNAWSLRQPYFWTTVKGLKPGETYSYYYIIDGTTAVADPYARLVLDPSADRFIPSEVFPDMPRYPEGKVPDGTILGVLSAAPQPSVPTLADRPALDELIIYELLIRDFTGSGSGDGTIAGLLPRLDYIKSLGVNAIELMPVMEFGGNNSWGYNPLFYFAPDKAYGTPDDYRHLIEEIHSRGMAVILDVVFNHADTRNPRQLMYAPSESPFFNATPPHAYNAFHDWNQDNPLVFSQWVDALKYWVNAYGIDGFRFDLVKGLGDNGSYSTPWNRATNAFNSPSAANTNRFNASRAERIGRLRDALQSEMPLTYFICEDLADAREDELLLSLGSIDWANINHPACQFAMGYSDGADLARFYAPLDGGRPYGSTLSYAESHDEERMAYKQQKWAVNTVKSSPEMQMRRLGSVAAMMLMSPGPHMIWQFQELGDAQPVKKADGDNNTDPRRPAWDLLDNPANASLLDTYRSLTAIRRSNPGFFTATASATVKASQSQWNSGFTLALADGDKRLVLAVNPLTDREITISTGLVSQKSEVILASPSTSPALSDDGSSVTLAPGAFAIISPAGSTGLPVTDTDPSAREDIYDLAGRRVPSDATLAPGIYINRNSRGHSTTFIVR